MTHGQARLSLSHSSRSSRSRFRTTAGTIRLQGRWITRALASRNGNSTTPWRPPGCQKDGRHLPTRHEGHATRLEAEKTVDKSRDTRQPKRELEFRSSFSKVMRTVCSRSGARSANPAPPVGFSGWQCQATLSPTATIAKLRRL